MNDQIKQLFIKGAQNIIEDYLTRNIPKGESSLYTKGIIVYKGDDESVFNEQNEEEWSKAFWDVIRPYSGMVTGLTSYNANEPHHITNERVETKHYKVSCVLPPHRDYQYPTASDEKVIASARRKVRATIKKEAPEIVFKLKYYKPNDMKKEYMRIDAPDFNLPPTIMRKIEALELPITVFSSDPSLIKPSPLITRK